MARKKIRVLVVDDSKYMRFLLTKLINDDPEIEVVGEARDGIDAVAMVKKLTPDVVTMDVEMPRMDGLAALKEIMKIRPIPVIMVSSLTLAGAGTTIEALQSGAVDFVRKPDGKDLLTLNRIKDELIAKIKAAAAVSTARLGGDGQGRPATPVVASKKQFESRGVMNKLLVIGSSTGGPKALSVVLPGIPADISTGILIVQHMPAGFTASLAARLDQISRIKVSEARHGDRIQPGAALVAPGDYHLRIARDGTVELAKTEQVNNVRPAVDVTLMDAAKVYGKRVICVILTGMGSDGTAGAAEVRKGGGVAIAQHGATCTVNGMPGSLIAAGQADRVVPLERIADELITLM